MKKLVQFSLIAGIVFINSLRLKANDFEIWTFVGAETEWKKVEFSLANANFFVPEGGWFLNFTQFSLDFVSEKAISLGVAYKQEYVKLPWGMRTEYRPMLHLYYTKRWNFLEFSDRNRMEFRIVEGELVNRYRNRLQLSYMKWKGIEPYLSTEFFIFVEDFDFARQRTILGMNVPIKSINLNLFAGHQKNEDVPEEWSDRFLLGTSLSYSF